MLRAAQIGKRQEAARDLTNLGVVSNQLLDLSSSLDLEVALLTRIAAGAPNVLLMPAAEWLGRLDALSQACEQDDVPACDVPASVSVSASSKIMLKSCISSYHQLLLASHMAPAWLLTPAARALGG